MIADRRRSLSLIAFFLLTFTLAVPFWVLGAMSGYQLMPGLPVSALMFVCPGLAALVLVAREHGSAGVKALLVRVFDYKGVTTKIWYAPLVLLNPVIFALSYVALRMLGAPVPDPQIQILSTLTLCAMFFVTALGEELGWSGYAIDPMQSRWGAVGASLLLGVAWAIFHFVALLQAHRSWEWIGWWSLWTVSARVIMVWLYNRTRRSVFGTVLFHAESNVCWQLFPIHGSYFDPQVTGVITAFLAIIAIALGKSMKRES